jgi:hypothetical protein
MRRIELRSWVLGVIAVGLLLGLVGWSSGSGIESLRKELKKPGPLSEALDEARNGAVGGFVLGLGFAAWLMIRRESTNLTVLKRVFGCVGEGLEEALVGFAVALVGFFLCWRLGWCDPR